jgi:hypothetical protein
LPEGATNRPSSDRTADKSPLRTALSSRNSYKSTLMRLD